MTVGERLIPTDEVYIVTTGAYADREVRYVAPTEYDARMAVAELKNVEDEFVDGRPRYRDVNYRAVPVYEDHDE